MKFIQGDVTFELNEKYWGYGKITKYLLSYLRYCPECWLEKETRYFRRYWRLKSILVCKTHKVQLRNKCKECNADLFQDIRNLKYSELSNCTNCEAKLEYNDEISHILSDAQDLVRNMLKNISYREDIKTDKIFGLHYDEIKFEYIEILKQNNGYNGFIGIEIAKYELISFFKNFDKFPSTRDPNMEKIRSMTKTKEWKDLGIKNWSHLQKIVFSSRRLNYGAYLGKKGLNRAIGELKAFYNNNDRLPTTRDSVVSRISSLITKSYWDDFGCDTWNNMRSMVFGMTNLDFEKYQGKENLERIKGLIEDYYVENDIPPISTLDEFEGIAVHRKNCTKSVNYL